jgi:hypothetical protein
VLEARLTALLYKKSLGAYFKERETQRGNPILSIYLILPAALGLGVYLDTKRNEYQR